MHRLFLPIVSLVMAVGLVFASPAAASPAGRVTHPASLPAALSAQTVTTLRGEPEPAGDGDKMSMLPKANAKGGTGNNAGGLIVGTILIGGWALLGVYLFRQGRERRAQMRADNEASARA